MGKQEKASSEINSAVFDANKPLLPLSNLTFHYQPPLTQSSWKSTEHVPQSNSGRLQACARVFPRTKVRRGFREQRRCALSTTVERSAPSRRLYRNRCATPRRIYVYTKPWRRIRGKVLIAWKNARVRAKHEAEELNIKRTCGHFIDTLRCCGMERAARKSRRNYACRWITGLNSPPRIPPVCLICAPRMTHLSLISIIEIRLLTGPPLTISRLLRWSSLFSKSSHGSVFFVSLLRTSLRDSSDPGGILNVAILNLHWYPRFLII